MDKRFENLPADFESDLQTIASRLYANHAAVMVGAGFSRNASRGYPDWADLGDIFYSILHPGSHKPKGCYWNIMDLADEVEASKGRAILDAIVQERIKDGTVPPSKLHEELLSLPWQDVFTTNYDTLLEATLPRLIGRCYSVVVKADQLAYAKGRRIVKLHGSFPSEKPFVLTTEDYRKYPQTHAPFVNTVRQAFLEHTFCLIGFSGDDPNFLAWAGWLRDCLGANGQPIYLITMEEPGSSRLSLLSRRNVRVVPLCKFREVNPEEFSEGYAAFFDYLKDKCIDTEHWIDLNQPQLSADPILDAKTLIEVWKQERESFSGKLCVPHYARFLLAKSLEKALSIHLDLQKQEEFILGTKFCYEYIWRLDKALRPLPITAMRFMCRLLDYWANEFQQKSFGRRNLSEVSLSYDMIYLIGVRLLRSYREMADVHSWVRTAMLIEKFASMVSDDARNEFLYQKALFALSHFSISGVRAELSAWNPDPSSPFALARCGMLYATIKDWDSAKRCLSEALLSVRKLSSYSEDVRLLHMESAIIAVWRWVLDNEFGKEYDKVLYRTLESRQLELRGLGCDVREEIQYFDQYFSKPPVRLVSEEIVDSYDLDSQSRTVSASFDKESGYSYFSFVEQLGLPLCAISSDAIKHVLADTIQQYPILALLYLSFHGNDAITKECLTRESFARIDIHFAESTLMLSLDCLSKMLDEGKAEPFSSMFHVHIQLSSRLLCCHIAEDVRQKALLWFCHALSKPELIPFGSGMDDFAKRLVTATPYQELPNLVREFAKIKPLAWSSESLTFRTARNPLYNVISLIYDDCAGEKVKRAFSGFVVNEDDWAELISGLQNSNEGIRSWCFASVMLYKLLGCIDEKKCADIKKTIVTKELDRFVPYLGDFEENVTLEIFDCSDVDYRTWYLKNILESDWFVSNIKVSEYYITNGSSRAIRGIISAAEMAPEIFGVNDVAKVLAKVELEWRLCKELIEKRDVLDSSINVLRPSLSEEGMARAYALCELIVSLYSHVKGISEKVIHDLISQFSTEGVPCLHAMVALSDDIASQIDNVLAMIVSSIHSHIEVAALDARNAFLMLLENDNETVFNLSIMVALSIFGWASPLDESLVYAVVKVLCKRERAYNIFQHSLFNMVARWEKILGLGHDTGISAEAKVKAIITLGYIMGLVKATVQLNDYRTAAISHMKITFADPLPYIEVYRAWENV